MSVSLSLARPQSLLRFSHSAKLPVIMQTEASECGLACLAMIAGYHGYSTDLTQLRHRFAISAHGSTLKQIMDIAGHMALTTRALKLGLEDIGQLAMPCILHWEMKHFVVLKSVHNEHIVIHDPAFGERRIKWCDVDKSFTGVALELTPSPEFEIKEDKQRVTLQHFWSRISGFKRSLLLILGFSLLLQLFAIASPYYMQTVIDDVILRGDINLLTVLAIGFGLLLLLETLTTVLRRLAILHLSSKLSIQMSSNVFHHLIRLPINYFNKRHMGDVISRFGSLATIRELLTTGLVSAVIDGLMAIITLIVMFLYDVQLTILVIGIVLAYALVRYTFYRPIRLLNEEAIIASARENSHFMESVRAAQTIKLFEQENQRHNQWVNRLADAMNKNIQITKWDIGFGTANQLLFGLENILIVFFAALAVIDSVFSVGMLYAFISYKTRFISAMDGLIVKWIEFKMLDLHFERLADIVFTAKDPNVQNASHSDSINSPSNLSGKISVDNIRFRHSAIESPLFSELSMTVNPGETVAIIGESGIGKTSLLKCIMGLLPVEKGSVEYDDVALDKLCGYRSQIAAVMQDDQLLTGTIAENIACFADHIDMQRVVLSAQFACIHKDICTMGMQYNTLVGDMGTTLSGGQKQRIILARALYQKPKILFMDEATSHLDIDNEKEVSTHLSKLNITRIVVAHRIQTIANANRVYELVGGHLRQVDVNALINNQTKTSTDEDQGDEQ